MISHRANLPTLAGILFLAWAASAAAKPPETKGGASKTPTPMPMQSQRFYAPVYKREMYGNALSVNDRCAVKHGPLNKSIRPVYVNGQPVGFC